MRHRRALAGLWAILPLPALLAALTLRPVPAVVPRHWSGPTADGYVTGPGFASALLSTVVLVALFAAGTALLRRVVPPAWSRWALALLGALGWGAVWLYVLTVWRVGVVGVEQVREWWALLAVLLGLGAGWVGYAVHGRRWPSPTEVLAQVPDRARVQALRGRAVRPLQPWSTELDSRTLRVTGVGVPVVLGAAAVWQLVAGSLALTVLLALVGLGTGLLALAWSSVTLAVDVDGLRIRSRVLPVQVSHVAAERVVGVEVQDLDPMRWGGVGLRPLPDRTSYIVDQAGGPGLVIHQRDGRRLALQVTEGDAAARAGARTLLQAAGQRLGQEPQARPAGSGS
ncbi:hypothetical protein [Ornithinimicrobium pratense]|uniref:DUF1648 domain-containing protein n=1 Tax=Ornithinimicrobium pratense TaxID=2593973 RepID=A0A5J6V8J5_9MICO|nr:hypothetical protein [Ornithinimicrobium pratense]QFG69393.1 hypothetical protein FY030_12355 [Ornithinimicrobium pratense]